MKSDSKHIDSACLLFKQWSHKSFAVFNSLGKVVHIGFILPIVCGLVTVKALLKRECLIFFGYGLEIAFDESEQMEELPDFEELLVAAESFNDNVFISSDFACCNPAFKSFAYYLTNHQRPNCGLFYFPNFFQIWKISISFCLVLFNKS